MIIRRKKPLWKGYLVDGRVYETTNHTRRDDLLACIARKESVMWILNDGRKMTLTFDQLKDEVEDIGAPQKSIKNTSTYSLWCYTFVEDN